MNELEQLQNAINIAVWYLENGDPDEALSVLLPHYNEADDTRQDTK